MSDKYDVFIVGGGPAGLTLGTALVASMPELKVGVADLRPFEVPNDARSFALAAGVTRIYEALGIWDEMTQNAAPIEHMRITDSGTGDLSRPLFLSFDGDVVPGRPYAYMVPNRDLTRAVMAAAQGRVDYFSGEEVSAYAVNKGDATLAFKSGKKVMTQLIVAADGARSKLRDMAGIDTFVHDYRQSGLVTTISHEQPHNNTAYEHFRPAGPFASLPLSGNRSSLVWTERSERVKDIQAMSPQQQAEMIGSETGWTLGRVTLDEPIQAFPLSLRLARHVYADRLALIGDAAHVVHPIAGQGLNLGLQDVASLTQVIVDSVRLGLDIGSSAQLEAYEKARRVDTALMAVATDSLNRLFSNDIAAVRALRDFGLGVVDRLTPLKTAMIRHAAAEKSGAPKLMRGMLA